MTKDEYIASRLQGNWGWSDFNREAERRWKRYVREMAVELAIAQGKKLSIYSADGVTTYATGKDPSFMDHSDAVRLGQPGLSFIDDIGLCGDLK